MVGIYPSPSSSEKKSTSIRVGESLQKPILHFPICITWGRAVSPQLALFSTFVKDILHVLMDGLSHVIYQYKVKDVYF